MRTITSRIALGAAAAGLAVAGVGSTAIGASSEPVSTGPAAATAASSSFTSTEYFHKIAAKHTGDALAVKWASTVNGESIVSWPQHHTQHNTQWHLDAAGGVTPPGFSGTFRLRNRLSDQCIDVNGAPVIGAALVQRPCDVNKLSQQWYYGPQSDSGDATHRFIYNRAAGTPGSIYTLVMKVANGGALGTQVVLAQHDGFSSSRWSITAPIHVTSTTTVY